MSVPVMLPPDREAERLEELEAAFLRSPSSTWPLASPATAVTVELPGRGPPMSRAARRMGEPVQDPRSLLQVLKRLSRPGAAAAPARPR